MGMVSQLADGRHVSLAAVGRLMDEADVPNPNALRNAEAVRAGAALVANVYVRKAVLGEAVLIHQH